jgi:hypothetical protein
MFILEIKRKNVLSLIFWRNIMFKKVIRSFYLYKEDKIRSKKEYDNVSYERNVILSRFSNVYIKVAIKIMVSKSSHEIDKKEKFVVNYFTQKNLKGFMTARRWFLKLRNLVLLRKIKEKSEKKEEIKEEKEKEKEKPVISFRSIDNIPDKGKDYEVYLQNLRDIRYKKRLAPKVNKY